MLENEHIVVHVQNEIRATPSQGILSSLRVDDPRVKTFRTIQKVKVQDFSRGPGWHSVAGSIWLIHNILHPILSLSHVF